MQITSNAGSGMGSASSSRTRTGSHRYPAAARRKPRSTDTCPASPRSRGASPPHMGWGTPPSSLCARHRSSPRRCAARPTRYVVGRASWAPSNAVPGGARARRAGSPASPGSITTHRGGAHRARHRVPNEPTPGARFARARYPRRSPWRQLTRLRVDNVGSMLRPARAARGVRRPRRTRRRSPGSRTRRSGSSSRARRRSACPLIVDGEFRRSGYLASFSEVEGARALARALDARHRRSREPRRGGAPCAATTRVHSDDLRSAATSPAGVCAATGRSRNGASRQAQSALPGEGDDHRARPRQHDARAGAPRRRLRRIADEFIADVVAVLREMIRQLVDAGCRYVHIDEPGFTAYADAASLEVLRGPRRGPSGQPGSARSTRTTR